MSANRRIVRRHVAEPTGEWPSHWPDVLKRVHTARGSHGFDMAMPRLANLLPFTGLRGMEAAVDLLQSAIERDARILIVGDFDCDGATATAVGVRGLRMLGARNVLHAVPNRIVHGYGLTPGLVEELAALAPDLVVTVDHGIACHAGITAAKARGWQILVTDHHLPGPTLPPADAIVNPNQPGDAFASKALAGVGVIFYAILALRARLGSKADLPSLLDLVAVGTVADMVPLDANNRALVGAGLRRLRAGQGCAGLRALTEVSGRSEASLTTSDIGFAIGPRLNAAGRLEDMAIGIECLLTDDAGHARDLAATLNDINAQRRTLQSRMQDTADTRIGDLDDSRGACLFDPGWHPGVIGLIASKLKEKLHRPAIAFAPVEPDAAMLRGSARSIPGFHIRDALALVDSRHPGLIVRFGGHAMAAGLSLAREDFPAFRDAFDDVVGQTLDEDLLTDVIQSDGALAAHEMNIHAAIALRDGGHWGQGYPEPLFDDVFEVLGWRVLKDLHLKLELGLDGLRFHAIQFNGWDGVEPGRRLRLAYQITPDGWRGGDAVQLRVIHREPV